LFFEKVRESESNGLDVNYRDHNGDTLLYISRGNNELIKWLLNRGADPITILLVGCINHGIVDTMWYEC
jgi:hypothetical protein